MQTRIIERDELLRKAQATGGQTLLNRVESVLDTRGAEAAMRTVLDAKGMEARAPGRGTASPGGPVTFKNVQDADFWASLKHPTMFTGDGDHRGRTPDSQGQGQRTQGNTGGSSGNRARSLADVDLDSFLVSLTHPRMF